MDWYSHHLRLASEIAVIKIEAHVKWTEPENPENVPAAFETKAATTKPVEMVVHVREVCSASAKTVPSLPDSCHPAVLVT